MKKKTRFYNGIPNCEDDLKYIRDPSVYTDYCSTDLYKSFIQKCSTNMYYYSVSHWEYGFDEKAKETYFSTFKPVADDLNPKENCVEIKRVATSFPHSFSHIGEKTVCPCDEKELKNKNHQPLTSSVGIEFEDPSLHSKHLCSNRDDEILFHKFNEDNTSKVRTEDKILDYRDNNFNGYIFYLERYNEKQWHDSYKYLLHQVSTRIEVDVFVVHDAVVELELEFFKKELKEHFNELLL